MSWIATLCTVLIFNSYPKNLPRADSGGGNESFVAYDLEVGGKILTMVPVSEAGRIGDFWMSATELTWRQYLEWAYNIPARGRKDFTSPLAEPDIGWGEIKNMEDKPVFAMTPYAAVRYCEWFSGKFGGFYRFPTVAEWELAYQLGGTAEKQDGAPRHSEADWNEIGFFVWKDVLHDLPRKAETMDMVTKVKSKLPNKLGIYDMEGNVAEWTISSKNSETGRLRQLNPFGISKLPVEAREWVTMGSSSFSGVSGIMAKSVNTPLNCKMAVTSSEFFGWMSEPDKEKLLNGIRLVRPRIPPAKEDWIRYWKCQKNITYETLFWLDLKIGWERTRIGWKEEYWFFPP